MTIYERFRTGDSITAKLFETKKIIRSLWISLYGYLYNNLYRWNPLNSLTSISLQPH